MTQFHELQDYLGDYFVTLPELAAMAGIEETTVEDLVAAGALPKPSYTLWLNGAYSSPIGGQHGPSPQGSPVHFYSPAAIWWARRAAVLSKNATQIAETFRSSFVSAFVGRLADEPFGIFSYPSAYVDGIMDSKAAATAGEAEWSDWISGGYGVCLRYWDATHAITKTCQRGFILELTEDGSADTLPPEDIDKLLAAMQTLEAVMLPFAPYQRPNGTPGIWIDRLLARFNLGHTRFAKPQAPEKHDRHCA